MSITFDEAALKEDLSIIVKKYGIDAKAWFFYYWTDARDIPNGQFYIKLSRAK